MVSRVKIMYNKKDTALVQFQDHALAHNGCLLCVVVCFGGCALSLIFMVAYIRRGVVCCV